MDLRNISECLLLGKVIVQNATTTPELLGVLSEFSYTESRFQELAKLVESASDKTNQCASVRAEQVGCTSRYNKAFTELRTLYRSHRKYSRKSSLGIFDV